MKHSIYLLFAILLSACLPAGVQIPQSPALSFLERKSGLIAFVGNDGNVYVTNQSAGNTIQFTDDVTENTQTIGYQFPTWSRDGNHIAFTRLEQSGGVITSEILLANVDDESVKSIYSSEIEHPIYLNWAPDNQNIALLSTTASQQTMMLHNVSTTGKDKQVLDTGTPFYWSWAPDAKTLLVHKNGATSSVLNQLAFLKTDSTTIEEYVMTETPASFQAPAWSPNGAFILLTTLSEDSEQQIILADSTGKSQKTIATFKINTAFAWSSDSEQYAYIISETQMQSGVVGPLHIGDIQGREEIIIDDQVIAFFWSPDGNELAYFVPFTASADPEDESNTEKILLLQLNVVDVFSGETRELATYPPTEQFFAIIPFIDQYHQSTTIWSPDSNNLVVSFLDPEGVPSIAIIPSSGNTQPRILAQGTFATWSWK